MQTTQTVTDAGQIARYMGLRQWSRIDDLGLVDCVVKGLPVSSIDTLIRHIDPEGRVMHFTHLIPKPSYYRHKEKKQPLSKDKSEMVYSLTRVFAEAMRIYHGEQERVLMFLTREHPLLDMRKPYDVARESTVGADLVLTLLRRADAGVAA